MPPAPPVITRVQLLRFGELSWENFERLCHRLTALDGNIEHCARYGRQGDQQQGIDIYARQTGGRYHCLQAKRHHKFGAAKLRDAVDKFLEGNWVSRASHFTIAVQAALQSTDVQEEIERQTTRLNEHNIVFSALGGEGLTDRLRAYPMLVDDFFGRHWVEAFLGKEVADSLGLRLDGGDFARVRSQLARVYQTQFHLVDPGSFGSIGDEDCRPALSLLERFHKPDILVRETARPLHRTKIIEADGERMVSGDVEPSLTAAPSGMRPEDVVSNDRIRRLPLVEWIGENQRLVVLGDAGCGKSTLLRVIALDLLHTQENFPEIAARWGRHIPVYIPFARWSSQVAQDGNAIGIKEIVRRSLEQLIIGSSIVDLLDRAIEDQRILLLIDGLDEWSNEQAAATTLHTLLTTVEAYEIPVIVSGRPRGSSRIGALPAHWKRGTVAPLSVDQQSAIAKRWFDRYAMATSDGIEPSESTTRASGFMAELARETNLGALATVPLLLIGLVTLALRGQILPRTKGDIYDQLVRILLEVHPKRRATASGDTTDRFRHSSDPDRRRAAIAQLAFAVREQTGGGAIPAAIAHKILRTFLASPQGFDLSSADASAAAGEILSVNAETQGLVVESAPGEVGFVHASFEEFLSAEHIGSWPFSEIEAFVGTHAGESRWRNVIVNLLGRIQRRNEFDQLVAIIEIPDLDEVAQYHRQFLLGDIAFGASIRFTATAKRLALSAINRVETEDWLPARREALVSVLKGLPDPALKSYIEQRIGRWLPARPSYERASLIVALGSWQPTLQLQELLFQAMHDEDRGVQRAAAAAYSKAFSPSNDACQRLIDGMARTRDLAAAAAMLESLAIGWTEVPEAIPLFEEAYASHSAELRLVGILGLAARGLANDEARDVVLRAQNVWSEVSHTHRDLAARMLIKYWPNDETLIKSALGRVSRGFDSLWEIDVATTYLLESSVNCIDVRAWILTELSGEYPFNVLADNGIWSQVGRLAAADRAIRAAANAYWCEPKNHLAWAHKICGYVAHIADPPVAAALIAILENKKGGFSQYWALKALLSGWGRNHPDVKQGIDSLICRSDEDLYDLISLLPDIIPDKTVARARLIRITEYAEVRRDLLAIGLEASACDAADNVAVAAILAFSDKLSGPFDPSYTLFRAFGAHADVRALALERARGEDAPLAAIATAYANDPEFSPVLFNAAAPLPVDLRTQIVEVAATGATGTILETALGLAMLETDPELRVRMVIAHHRALLSPARDAAREALLKKAITVGSEFESIRAAALAGLATIGALDVLAVLEERGKPVALHTGSFIEAIPSVERLVCERFAEFETAFGVSFSKRLDSFARGDQLAKILSVAPSASPAARSAFLALAERGKIPLTPQTLRALAAERPRSELLLTRCWQMLERVDHSNSQAINGAEVGLILREHFAGDAVVRHRLVEWYKSTRITKTAIPLAVFAPDAEELPLPVDFNIPSHDFGGWTVAVYVAAYRADAATFCKLLEAMVTRRWRSQFDAQHITNLAIEERLQRDSELERLMGTRIVKDTDPSISGSFARYLTAAGKLSPEVRGVALNILHALALNQRLPTAGYDAISDQWRAVRATLLDAVYAGLELS